MLKKMGREKAQGDVQSLGLIIVECLEPATALCKGDALTSGTWDAVLVEFQVSTKMKTARELLQHDFIQ